MNNKTKKKYSHKNKKFVYTKKHYSSGDGMITSIWGPALWHYLHTMSFNYPNHPTRKDKIHYKQILLNLQNVLPCNHCRTNLKTNFRQLPLTNKDMKNRESYSRYIYNLHELINKMLNKKSNLTYCKVRERYEHFRSRCTEEKPKIFKFSKKYTVKKKEKGCTEPLYGSKSKCIINIVPQKYKGKTLRIDKSCIKRRI
jgi:hypothetical protein